tara:strand:- start:815 stop:1069 length:255 start_codon:yes stop_codon:yes gene_type:complete
MIDILIICLFFLFLVVTIAYGIWVGLELIQVATERDEWRELAISANAKLENPSNLSIYKNDRAFRSNNTIYPNRYDSVITNNKG